MIYTMANLFIVIVESAQLDIELFHVPETILGVILCGCVWYLKKRYSLFRHTCRRIKDKLMRYRMNEVSSFFLMFIFSDLTDSFVLKSEIHVFDQKKPYMQQKT